ncbi:uncharacterized protein LOC131058852 [Cryptomeria japonica]|uniref:uncharacterized protein LOC131058852 n=1 Tax=Cryptomeria japonica TaxID=3369 RepID=UPI0027DA7B17|nr:uncharacterized protein LOC131058852 [Cryptomeria japonica]
MAAMASMMMKAPAALNCGAVKTNSHISRLPNSSLQVKCMAAKVCYFAVVRLAILLFILMKLWLMRFILVRGSGSKGNVYQGEDEIWRPVCVLRACAGDHQWKGGYVGVRIGHCSGGGQRKRFAVAGE